MYAINMGEKTVGRAEVKKEGLYYRFFCTCTPPDQGIHRVQVSDGETVRDLGICVPDGGNFSLTTRVPIKYLKEDCLSFTLLGKEKIPTAVPVTSGEPFEYLDQLETARLQLADGQAEIIIDPTQDPPDSDPNQGYPNRSASI